MSVLMLARYWPVIPALMMTVPAFWILPAGDDFNRSSPIGHFSWDVFRPDLFWRPLEVLHQLIVGRWPQLYPAYPHLLATSGHLLSGWLVCRIACRLAASYRPAVIASVLFLLSPAVTAAAWSVDGSSQTWSTALGLASVLTYLSPGRARLAGWLAFSVGASLWKESGVSWFLAAPLISGLANEAGLALRDTFRGLLIGLLGIAAYLFARHLLGLTLADGGSRYALVSNPLIWAENASMLIGVSLTTVDTVALFGDRDVVKAAATLLLGLPVLLMLAWQILRTSSRRAITLAPLCILPVLAPHIFISHVSELYAHPIVAVLSIFLGTSFRDGGKFTARVQVLTLVMFVTGAVIVDAHKLAGMTKMGRSADEVARKIVGNHPRRAPRSLCVVRTPPLPRGETGGYSVFQGNAAAASGWGRSARSYWGWDMPVVFRQVSDRRQCPASDRIVALADDGAVQWLD